MVNQTMVVPPALTDLIPGIPGRLSDAILKGLAKNPAQRFENCVALAQEIMRAVPSRDAALWRIIAPMSPNRTRLPRPLSPIGRRVFANGPTRTRIVQDDGDDRRDLPWWFSAS